MKDRKEYIRAFWTAVKAAGISPNLQGPKNISKVSWLMRGLPDLVAVRRYQYANPDNGVLNLVPNYRNLRQYYGGIDPKPHNYKDAEIQFDRNLALYTNQDLQWLSAYATGAKSEMCEEEFKAHVLAFTIQVIQGIINDGLDLVAGAEDDPALPSVKQYKLLSKSLTRHATTLRGLGECLASRSRYNQWVSQENQSDAPESFLDAFRGLFVASNKSQ